MKRFFLLLMAVILSSTAGNREARAQYGSNSILDMSAEIEKQQQEAKAKMKGRTAAGATATNGARSPLADRFGRLDMAGHQTPGYPALRNNAPGETPAYMSRGAYNPNRRRTPAVPRTNRPATPAGTAATAKRATTPGAMASAPLGGPPPLPFAGASKDISSSKDASSSKAATRSRRSTSAKSASGPPPLPF